MPHTAIQRGVEAAAGLALAHLQRRSTPNGRLTGRRPGSAFDFADYRDYQPGDDLRRVDWNVFARHEQLMVRQYNDEIEPSCELILDHSASMSVLKEKGLAALSLAAMLATAADNGGFCCRFWYADTTWQPEPHPTSPLLWKNVDFTAEVSPDQTLASHQSDWRPGLRIFISDLLWPGSPAAFLTRLSSGTRQLLLLCPAFDDLETEMKDESETLLEDAEDNGRRELRLDGKTVRAYQANLRRHRQLWQDAAERASATLLFLTSDDFSHVPAVHPLVQAGILRTL